MFGKLFGSMYDGTLATKGPWQALVTFQQLVILCNRHGEVDMTSEAIARRTTIPLEVIQTGIASLLQPDTDSRSPAENGRRIVPLDDHRSWGWRIVNYSHYRQLRSAEDRREYMRNLMADKRAKGKGKTDGNGRRMTLADVSKLAGGEQCSPIAEAVSKKQKHMHRSRGTSVHVPYVAEPSASAAQKPEKEPKAEVASQATWSAYATAYEKRYGVPPVRNARANSLIHAFIKAWGVEESPAIATFYLTSNRALYINSHHDLQLLVRDGAGLRTEWKVPAAPPKPVDWWTTTAGIRDKGKELGVKPRQDDTYDRIKARVFLAAGDGPWMHKLDWLLEKYIQEFRRESST